MTIRQAGRRLPDREFKGLSDIPEGYRILHLLGTEVLLAELGGPLREECFAGEHVYERPVGVLSEMSGDLRGLDQLDQRIPHDLGFGTEVDHDGFAVSLHIDVLCEIDRELGDDLSAADPLVIAFAEIHGDHKAPVVFVIVLLHASLIGDEFA